MRAASIERALRLAGEHAHVVSPMDAEPFFAPGVEKFPPIQNQEEVVAA